MDGVYGNLSDIPEPFRSFNIPMSKTRETQALSLDSGEISDEMFFMLLLMILM